MNSFCKFFNTSPKITMTCNISSAPNIARKPKKQLPVQVHPSLSTKGFFQREEISTKQLTLVGGMLAKSYRSISVRSSAAATPNDEVESENIQVFISFRGETRTGFTGHLYKKLIRAGYITFIDEMMRRGENIEEELTKAIRSSEASVIVISPGYASSQSCLHELVEILRCRRFLGHKVLPVFYHVDPDEVYSLSGSFGAAFDGLVERLEDARDKRVNSWKEALKEVSSISGVVLRQYQYETYFIDQIVKEVKKLLSRAPQRVPSFLVFWHSLIHLWLQTALAIESYMIIDFGGIVAASKYLFSRRNEGLMIIRLGIAVTLYLRSVKPREKLKNDNERYETYFIGQIVKEVKKLLSRAPQRVPSFLVFWHSLIHLWLQTALAIESYMIIDFGGIVAASKYLFSRRNEGLMIIRLGIAVTLYLRSVKPREKLKNDNER